MDFPQRDEPAEQAVEAGHPDDQRRGEQQAGKARDAGQPAQPVEHRSRVREVRPSRLQQSEEQRQHQQNPQRGVRQRLGRRRMHQLAAPSRIRTIAGSLSS
jgi:hypothetical protein